MNAETTHLDQRHSNFLKGLAITVVVLLHTLAYLKGIYTTSEYSLFFISLDQLSRFCVPLFIMISAYGLTRKYGTHELRLGHYLKSRVLKLVPLYLLWSFLSLVLMSYVPAWFTPGKSIPMWSILLLGQADYHLYFTSLIFQLYFLYPWLLQLVKRFPVVTIAVALIIQLLIYGWFSESLREYISLPSSLQTDGLQYVIFLSWIAYFVIGIKLALVKNFSQFWQKFVPIIAVLGLLIVVYDSWNAIQNKMDPLFALKFTRFSVMAYALPASIALIITSGSLHIGAKNIFQWLGKESFLLFLSHTIFLRIVFSYLRDWLTFPELLLVTIVWVLAIFVSKKYFYLL